MQSCPLSPQFAQLWFLLIEMVSGGNAGPWSAAHFGLAVDLSHGVWSRVWVSIQTQILLYCRY